MTKRDARRALTRYEVIPVKGESIRESIPGVSRFRAEEPEGEFCEFDMLGACGGRDGFGYAARSSTTHP